MKSCLYLNPKITNLVQCKVLSDILTSWRKDECVQTGPVEPLSPDICERNGLRTQRPQLYERSIRRDKLPRWNSGMIKL